MTKKFYCFIYSFICYAAVANAQYVTIPDEYFRSFLADRYPSSFNAEGLMDTTNTEITTEDSLSLSLFPANSQVANLEGVQYFKSLLYLECSYTAVTELPVLPLTLTWLDCNNSYGLLSLPSLPRNLRYLDCSSCLITSLPALPDSLKFFDLSFNSVNVVPTLPDGLLDFDCSVNQIDNLPDLPKSLLYFDCSFNFISSLPDIINTNMTMLVCGYNLISELPQLPKNLETLYCPYNELTTLPILREGFIELNCSANPMLGNYLSTTALPKSLLYYTCEECEIDHLPALPVSLRFLDCGFNHLTSLPILPDTLLELVCLYNELTALPELPRNMYRIACYHNNIYCLPRMPDYDDPILSHFDLDYDGDKIKCIPNLPPNAILTDYSDGSGFSHDLPICNPTTNSNRCTPFPLITGTVFFDTNNNGLQDAGEPAKKNIKVQLADGSYAFTDGNGYFELTAELTGNTTVSIVAPTGFSVSPDSISYNFKRYDTSVSAQFALHSITDMGNLSININPLEAAAKPGAVFPYLVYFENTGTTIQSAEMIFNYDSTRLSYDSSSNISMVNSDDHLSLTVNNFAPGQQEDLIAYFTVKPTAVNGDSLFSNALLRTSENNYTDSNSTIISNSFSTNDKQATEQLSPAELGAGKSIDYSIHFQNTGTGTVFNLVIADTLSDLADIHTLEITASSHPCKTTVKNNIIYFEFLDIFLPESNADELKSHGFVNFRIKPVSPYPVNSFIENKAGIYFNYETGLVTNTTLTAIKEPGRIFMFTGDGNWDEQLNWKDGVQPPGSLTQNEMVIINPITEGSCILNVPVNVFPGASIIVESGKQFNIPGAITGP